MKGVGIFSYRRVQGWSTTSVYSMFRLGKASTMELVELEHSVDPEIADAFFVLYQESKNTCTIMCGLPYDDKTDLVLREFYDMMVDKHVSRNKNNLYIRVYLKI